EEQPLTRRAQLGLKADKKEEKEVGKGKGRGRGRGRGKKPSKVEEAACEPKDGNDDEIQTTPVRPRRLRFEELASPEGNQLAAAAKAGASPPIRQEKKKVRRSKAKAEAKSSSAQEGGQEGNGMSSSPPVKQAKKRARKPKKAEETEPAPEPEAARAAVGEPSASAAGSEPGRKPPGRAASRAALNHLIESKQDPAAWLHVQKLWEAMDNLPVKQSDTKNIPKYMYWSFSMYWKTNRMGVLQKKEGSERVNVCSFGVSNCRSISVDFVGGDKPAKEMKDVQGLEVQAYKDALQDIVKAIAVADLLGKSLKDF
ncbi:unnamed protein product, partial [Durusdinium trenchii]